MSWCRSLNFQGQLSSILRSEGVRAESITQYTGLPFKISDLMERITARAGASAKKMVRV